VYNDNALDRLFIKIFTHKMAAQLPGAAGGGGTSAPLLPARPPAPLDAPPRPSEPPSPAAASAPPPRPPCAGVQAPADPTWDDFVVVSKEIMRGRNTDQQREVIRAILFSLMPEATPAVFR